MRKVLLIILVFLSIIALTIRFGAKPLGKILGLQSKAGIRIEANTQAKVLINNKEVGNTPYQDDSLSSGDLLISLKGDSATESAKTLWEGYAKLSAGTLTVVNREIAEKRENSSGEIISLESGKGATVISTPTGADVYVDTVLKGRTPLSLPDLSLGEHQFLISKDNFLKRSIRATVVDEYNLVLTVDLAIAEPDLTKLPTTPISATQQVVVKATPTGFLRVRATANLNAKEVGQVKPGETLTLLEEQANWDRVRLNDSKSTEGWVSSAYVEKKNN